MSAKHVFRLLGERQGPNQWFVSTEESNQGLRVLRLKDGDVFELFDGKGWVAEAIVSLVNKKRLTFSIRSECYSAPSDLRLEVAIGALKKGSLEEVLPMLVELGVSAIFVFLQKGHESFRLELKQQARFDRIMVEAAKVSKRPYLPVMNYCASFDQFRQSVSLFEGVKITLDPSADISLAEISMESNCLICIGSEKGFSEDELTGLQSDGFLSVALGSEVLRAKTAALAAVAVCVSKIRWR